MEFWYLNVVCFVTWTEGLNELGVGGVRHATLNYTLVFTFLP